QIDVKLFKKISTFASWSLLGNISFLARSQGNAMLLNIFFGTILNAAYAISNQVITQVSNFSIVLTKAFMPQIVKSYACGDLERMHLLMFNAIRYSFIIMIIIVVPLMGELQYILDLWLVDYPQITIDLCRLMLIQSILLAMLQPLETSVQATGRIVINQIFMTFLTGFLMLLTYLALVRGLAPQIVVWSNIITYILLFVFRVFYLKYLVGIIISKFISEVIIRVFVISCLSAFALSISNFISDYSIVRIMFVWIFVLISSIVIGLRRVEIELIIRSISRLTSTIPS
ncbi:MAG: hypothetical protein ACRCZM_04460, partial [Bacteroidales bacterium]